MSGAGPVLLLVGIVGLSVTTLAHWPLTTAVIVILGTLLAIAVEGGYRVYKRAQDAERDAIKERDEAKNELASRPTGRAGKRNIGGGRSKSIRPRYGRNLDTGVENIGEGSESEDEDATHE